MKVNFTNEVNSVQIGILGVGDTFRDPLRSNLDQTALYMIVDKNDYIKQIKMFNPYGFQPVFLAVNLATGQLTEYLPDTKVIPVDIEINVLKP